MITVRPSQERGHANHGWLDSYHTFSFANYYDPRHQSFRQLRVINEDRVQPGYGFGTHPHRDMEILTYVLAGAVEHKDSMGNGSVILPGDVQVMSAGTGITHSEFNPSQTDPLHLLQIWIYPEKANLPPRYEQKAFPRAQKTDQLRLVAAQDGRDGAVTICQDVDLYSAYLTPGKKVTHTLQPGRHAWVQVAQGTIRLQDQPLRAGDGASISAEDLVTIEAITDAEVLLFDLA